MKNLNTVLKTSKHAAEHILTVFYKNTIKHAQCYSKTVRKIQILYRKNKTNQFTIWNVQKFWYKIMF